MAAPKASLPSIVAARWAAGSHPVSAPAASAMASLPVRRRTNTNATATTTSIDRAGDAAKAHQQRRPAERLEQRPDAGEDEVVERAGGRWTSPRAGAGTAPSVRIASAYAAWPIPS